MYGLYEGGKVTLNGVRIGRVERFFLGDAIENAPVPVLPFFRILMVKMFSECTNATVSLLH